MDRSQSQSNYIQMLAGKSKLSTTEVPTTDVSERHFSLQMAGSQALLISEELAGDPTFSENAQQLHSVQHGSLKDLSIASLEKKNSQVTILPMAKAVILRDPKTNGRNSDRKNSNISHELLEPYYRNYTIPQKKNTISQYSAGSQ